MLQAAQKNDMVRSYLATIVFAGSSGLMFRICLGLAEFAGLRDSSIL